MIMKRLGITLSMLCSLFILSACAKSNDTTTQTSTNKQTVGGELTVLTDRTDSDGLFKEIETKFIKNYPDVTAVHYENIADYDKTVMTRLNSGDYGDVLFIPFSMAGNRENYPNYFTSIGTTKELSKKYLDVYEADYNGQVYGLPVALNSLGFIYNQQVLKEAGISEEPTTTEDFLKDLETIKAKTTATPFYANYQTVAMWAGALTSFGGEQFKSATLSSGDAFAKGMPIRQVMDLFYAMASKGLIEKDPLTLDSQTAFQQLAAGKIAMLMHGSQEVATIQGESKDTIKIMNFPVTTKGKTSLPLGAPAVMGVNKHSKNKKTAEAFVTFFTSKASGYSEALHGIPNAKADLSKDQQTLITNSNVILTVAKESAKTNTTYAAIADEVGVSRLTDVLQKVINIGLYPADNPSYESYVKELSEKWTIAAKSNE